MKGEKILSVLAIENIEVIPQVSQRKEVTLHPGDVIVAKVDLEKVDFEVVQSAYNMLEKAFPNNNIMVLDKNIEIEVYRNAH